jgi:peptidyl-prolyl cis-trans isomerase SurA
LIALAFSSARFVMLKPLSRSLFRLILIAGLVVLASRVSVGQDVQGIVATVNDEIISAYDMEQRLKIVLGSTGLPSDPDTRERLKKQVLNSLIQDRLKMQEAKRSNVNISDAEIQQAFGRIAKQNNMTAGSFSSMLNQVGVDPASLKQQIEAELAWRKLVGKKFGRFVNIGEDEIDAVLQRYKENIGKEQMLVSEIFLPVESPDKEEEVKRFATRISDQIRKGANFAAIARQFSQGTTAAAGGDIGWVQSGQMAEELEAKLEAMAPQTYSDPIRSVGGYYILALRDRRVIAKVDPGDTTYNLSQLVIPLSASADENEVRDRFETAENLRKRIKKCNSVDALAKEIDSPMSGSLGTLKMKDLPEEFQGAVKDLLVGDVSKPVRTSVGLHLLVVCSRTNPQTDEPTRDSVRNQLLEERLQMMARRYIRDLRRDALVEIR